MLATLFPLFPHRRIFPCRRVFILLNSGLQYLGRKSCWIHQALITVYSLFLHQLANQFLLSGHFSLAIIHVKDPILEHLFSWMIKIFPPAYASPNTDSFFSSSLHKARVIHKIFREIGLYTVYITWGEGGRSDEWAWRSFLLCPLEENLKTGTGFYAQ